MHLLVVVTAIVTGLGGPVTGMIELGIALPLPSRWILAAWQVQGEWVAKFEGTLELREGGSASLEIPPVFRLEILHYSLDPAVRPIRVALRVRDTSGLGNGLHFDCISGLYCRWGNYLLLWLGDEHRPEGLTELGTKTRDQRWLLLFRRQT